MTPMTQGDVPIPAATVILLRDSPAFEVLMVERREGMAFAAGALVFPGGRVDSGDADPSWADHATGLDPVIAPAQVAAVREAFEETGVLLARSGGQIIDADRAETLGAWRAGVAEDDARFLDLIRAEKLTLACDALSLFAHWVAPPGLHRRFDTLFFAARCPPGQRAIADGAESAEALWIAPGDAVAARASGARRMIFPTVRNVELLAEAASSAEVLERARRRKIAPIMPAMETRGGVAWLTIPKDMGYPVTAEPLDVVMRG